MRLCQVLPPSAKRIFISIHLRLHLLFCIRSFAEISISLFGHKPQGDLQTKRCSTTSPEFQYPLTPAVDKSWKTEDTSKQYVPSTTFRFHALANAEISICCQNSVLYLVQFLHKAKQPKAMCIFMIAFFKNFFVEALALLVLSLTVPQELGRNKKEWPTTIASSFQDESKLNMAANSNLLSSFDAVSQHIFLSQERELFAVIQDTTCSLSKKKSIFPPGRQSFSGLVAA